MSAPAGTGKTSQRKSREQRRSEERARTAEREDAARTAEKQRPSEGQRKTGRKERKTGRTTNRAATGTRSRSTAAERAYARREERRSQAKPAQGELTRRPRWQREGGGLRGPLRVVSPKAKQLQERITLSRVPFVVAVMVLMAVGLIATLWLAIAGVSGSYELRQGKIDIARLSEQKEQLIRQNSYLDSTPALQQRAEQWGWVPAPEPAHLVRDPGGGVRVVGDPQVAEAPPAPAPPPAPPQPPVQQPGQPPVPAAPAPQAPGGPQPDPAEGR
jgi:cell division protein FtsI (penicillin-binding protein 3)